MTTLALKIPLADLNRKNDFSWFLYRVLQKHANFVRYLYMHMQSEHETWHSN